MPTITRISYLTLEPRYLVDDVLRPGTVEAARWIVPVCGWERRVWLLDGRPHRTDGPAIVDVDSPFQEWHQHGVLHRDDGAARVTRTGVTVEGTGLAGIERFSTLLIVPAGDAAQASHDEAIHRARLRGLTDARIVEVRRVSSTQGPPPSVRHRRRRVG